MVVKVMYKHIISNGISSSSVVSVTTKEHSWQAGENQIFPNIFFCLFSEKSWIKNLETHLETQTDINQSTFLCFDKNKNNFPYIFKSLFKNQYTTCIWKLSTHRLLVIPGKPVVSTLTMQCIFKIALEQNIHFENMC